MQPKDSSCGFKAAEISIPSDAATNASSKDNPTLVALLENHSADKKINKIKLVKANSITKPKHLY